MWYVIKITGEIQREFETEPEAEYYAAKFNADGDINSHVLAISQVDYLFSDCGRIVSTTIAEDEFPEIESGGVDISDDSFTDGDRKNKNFNGADFSGRDFSGEDLSHANFRGANLRRAVLSGADLRTANLSKADLSEADLSGADLRYANLKGAKLTKADLSETDLCNAKLKMANLTMANLFKSDLRQAELTRADISDADCRGATLTGAYLFEANLSGADLSSVSFREAILRNANLHNTNLTGADLSMANLSGSNLSKSDLSDANLNSADFTKANLGDVNLNGADLRNANVSGTVIEFGDTTIQTKSESKMRKVTIIFKAEEDYQRFRQATIANQKLNESDEFTVVDNISKFICKAIDTGHDGLVVIEDELTLCENVNPNYHPPVSPTEEAEKETFLKYSKMSYPVPDKKTIADVCDALLWVIHYYGPLMRKSVYRIYREGCSANIRMEAWFRELIDDALNKLLESDQIVQEDELNDGSLESLVLRIAGAARVQERLLDRRKFHEIPTSELLSVLEKMNSENLYIDHHQLLAHYDLERLTRPRRDHMNRVFELYRSKTQEGGRKKISSHELSALKMHLLQLAYLAGKTRNRLNTFFKNGG